MGVNLGANLTLRNGPQGRVSKGGHQSGRYERRFTRFRAWPILRDGRYAASSG